MAENVKGLAMRYKHDGVVYELDSGKLVHTTGEQSIDGKKVFKTVPQVEGAPVEDNDVTNKKYVQDALDAFAAPKVASFTITATNSANAAEGAAPVEINKLKIFLADGRRLDPVFMEEGDLKGSTEAKLLVLTLNKQDQSDLTPTKVAKTEIESYALKDGEFLGKLYPCAFFAKHQDMYANSDYQDPWNQYWTKAVRFWDQERSTSGQLRIDIFDIDQMVQKLSFTSTASNRKATFTATANDGAKEENGDVQDKGSNNFEIIFPKMGEMLSKPGPVLLSTNQVVKDVKTFATPPKSANAPVANDDVANKAYVDNLNNELKGYVDSLIQKPGFDIELQIGVTALTSWNAFSQLNILLDNGKRLEAKYVEDGIKAGSDPAKVVLVMTDNPDAEIPEPELKQASFFDTYELGSNEYACEFYNATAMGLGTIHSDPRQANPWRAYLVNGITSGQKGYYLKLVIKQLQDAISTVQFYCGDKHNGYGYPPKNFIFKASCNGVTTDEQVSKDNPTTKELIKFDIPADALPLGDNYVDLVSEQTISGVKTFKAPPKSLAEAVDGNDLITKDFATKNFFARENSARDFDILVKMKNDGTWVGFTQFKVLLSNGTRLDIKHLESGSATSATKPLVAVFKTVSDSAAAITAPQRQAKTFFDSYKLEEGEYKGTVSFYKVVGKFNPASSDINPWNVYVGNGNANTYDGIYGVHIEQLDKGLRGVNFKFGDSVSTSWNYTCQQCGIVFTTDLGSLEVEYKGDMSDATEATIELPSDSDILGGFVTVEKDQGISGVKTFKKAPKCLADAVDDNDLVTKAYVDSKSSSVDKLPVQEITVFTKAASNNTILMNYLLLDTVDGTHVDPIYYEKKTAYNNLQEPLRVIFSVNAKRYVSSSYTSVSPTEMETRDMDSYVLKDGEFMGSISLPNLVSGGKVNFVGTSDNLPWFHLKVTTRGATEDTPIFKIKIEGKLPAVAKASFQADTTYPGEDFKLAVTAGGITKESEVKRAVAGAVLNLTCTEVPIYEDYYVNTVANQSIMGTKVFKSAPQYLNLAPVARNNGDNLVNFANLASSIGVAVPEKQCIALTADAKQTKHNNGSTNYMYSWSITVWFQNLVPAFIDPLTGKITPLYIKHYCTDGRAILTTTKPSVEFDKGSVTSKSTSEMDSYTLRKGEYLCKAYWYFLNQRANIDVNGSYIKKNDICGAKVLDLFTNTSSAWREYTTPQSKDASSNIAPSSQVIVEFYNTPEIRYVRAYGSGVGSLWIDHYPFGLAERDSAAQIKSTSAAYNSSEFQEFGAYYRDYFALNAPTSPVEMLPVAPIVANMQATIEKLEARIKTLEDAAKP